MEREEIKKQILELLKKYTLDKSVWDDASEDAELINDLGIKSTRIVDALLEIEDLHDIVFEPEDMDEIFLLQEMIDTTVKLIEAKK